ncbi:putative rhodanese domain-containing dual specificity protein phosphatase [Diplonema papillatum]|nr:putative rhodanese domain-containing dual specificity protein phosphatase [Diplonema papillatum]
MTEVAEHDKSSREQGHFGSAFASACEDDNDSMSNDDNGDSSSKSPVDDYSNDNRGFDGELLVPGSRGDAPMLAKPSKKCARFKFKAQLASLAPVEKQGKAASEKAANKELHATMVLPWLYLGAAHDANREEEIRRLSITHIVNLQQETATKRWDNIRYLHITVSDHSDSPIARHFNDVIKYLEEARSSGGVALVHCRQGISRSATVIIAYLMNLMRVPYKLAHDVVRRRRAVINPNLGFVTALEGFQEHLKIDATAPLPTHRSVLEKYELDSPLCHEYPPGQTPPASPAKTPKTAPPFQSLGFS